MTFKRETGEMNNSTTAGAKRKPRAPFGSTVLERLQFHSIPEPNSGCWLWLGHVMDNGAAQSNIDGRTVQGHRAAWIATRGPIPDCLFVLHKCDVRSCVNPDHLFLGTHADNMADRNRKGRQARGERGSLAKLTEAQARAIFTDPRPNGEIALAFNVSRNTVSDIKRGVRWAHLSGAAQ